MLYIKELGSLEGLVGIPEVSLGSQMYRQGSGGIVRVPGRSRRGFRCIVRVPEVSLGSLEGLVGVPEVSLGSRRSRHGSRGFRQGCGCIFSVPEVSSDPRYSVMVLEVSSEFRRSRRWSCGLVRVPQI